MSKTATFPPFSKNGPPPSPNDMNAPSKRDIPKEHPFDPKALKPMSKALLASSTALGHALTAYRYLSRLKSTTVSPDGRIGGRGYVMEIQAARQKLYDASEALSAVSDTLYDEIQAPHWKPKLAMLDENDQEDVVRFVGEAQEVLENPEEEAEEQLDAIEKENDGKGSKGKKKDEGEDDPEAGSQLPGGGFNEPENASKPQPVMKEASSASFDQLCDAVDPPEKFEAVESRFITKDELRVEGAKADPQMLADVKARSKAMSERIMKRLRKAEVAPGGPRVDNRDPDGGTGPWGSFNPPEDAGSDGWADEEGISDEYLYQSEWENDTSHKKAGTYPEYVDRKRRKNEKPMSEDKWTCTQDPDCYLTRGEIDRADTMPGKDDVGGERKAPWKNQPKQSTLGESAMPGALTDDTPTEGRDFGLGYGARGQGEEHAGEWGPHAELPGVPSQSSGDIAPSVDVNLNQRHSLESLLPGDTVEPVARADYYEGEKGNLVQQAVGWSQATAPVDEDLSLVDTGYVHEDLQTPWLAPGEPTPRN